MSGNFTNDPNTDYQGTSTDDAETTEIDRNTDTTQRMKKPVLDVEYFPTLIVKRKQQS